MKGRVVVSSVNRKVDVGLYMSCVCTCVGGMHVCGS